MALAPNAKGTVPFGEYRTWYRVTGDLRAGVPPLVVAHGGPGSTHDYLRNIAELAGYGRPVVHYDQLGNGGSTRLPGRGADFWTPQLFLDELENLLGALGIAGDYTLLGHSWGGVLAARHAATRPAGLRGLIIANSPASYPLWLRELAVLRRALPPDVAETLTRHEEAGTTDSAEYVRAVKVFNDRHVCRLDPLPRDFVASLMEIHDDPAVYYTMNGPSEFHVNGTLRDYSVVDRCPDIAVPTLLISGRHDEVTPAAVQPFADLIPDVRWQIFEDSSHLPHLEEPERFLRVVREFLESVPDRGATPVRAGDF
ncbi:proline iminopeptidase-family hydrolase [Microbispora sp. NBC_01189]|uniref:proline iminopeptidase-family hydrolase n=1 Tax=Microbispora sp. NBC_01189 TaxID=2903583 RepID=UPI002E0FC086|nr:proline iminopeptidase-family hydrolase [Microbispora sp. NBC_01189]